MNGEHCKVRVVVRVLHGNGADLDVGARYVGEIEHADGKRETRIGKLCRQGSELAFDVCGRIYPLAGGAASVHLVSRVLGTMLDA